MAQAPASFEACDTASDDVCLLGFTSGTTGGPKATMHFHRDVLAIADSYGRHVLRANAEDRFIGSPPLAFTFGLGGLVVFPMAVGASSILLEKAGPNELLEAIGRFGATILFTAPTAYRAMLRRARRRRSVQSAPMRLGRRDAALADLRSLEGGDRAFPRWTASARPKCCIFSSPRRLRKSAPARPGTPVPGYEAKILDAAGREAPRGTAGRSRRARADRLPLSRATSGRRATCATAGTSPATHSSRTRTAISGSRRGPTI